MQGNPTQLPSERCLERLPLAEDPIAAHVLSKPRPFVYADQLAVVRDPQYRGTGRLLAKRLVEDAAKGRVSQILCSISHYPIRNTPSLNLAFKLGFKHLEEIEFDSLTFGIYKKEL